MKSIKEKAKAYDETLERAKQLLRTSLASDRRIIEIILPELKENEDESIRGAIIHFIAHTPTVPKGIIGKEDMIAWLEKQGEQKPQGKSALEAINEEKFDNANKVEPKDYSSIDPHFFKTTDKIEPKFKVKYAGSEYNVFETKDIAGVTFYGIEDEPNHIDYVQAENCEIIDGYGIKKNGCSFPTKPIMFSEQKPADKVKPKFHEGEWVVNNDSGCVYQIKSIRDDEYCLCPLDSEVHGYLRITDIDNECYLWTIADARDGDVLEVGYHGRLVVGIVSHINKSTGKVDVCCLLEANNFKVGIYYAQDKINPHPASKERRDILFQKMKEAGYEWDAEKKKLKELSQSEVTKMSDQEEVVEIPFEAKDSELQEAIYYVPKGFHAEIDDDKVVIKKGKKFAAWSEEDEQITLSIEQVMNCASLLNIVPEKIDKIRTWLKSLKQRIGG